MKGLIPYGGFQIAAGSGTQALSTSAAAVGWTALGAAATDYTAGDQAVRPDLANNRLLLAPGTYEIDVQLAGTIDAAQIITLAIRKNGNAISGTSRALTWVVSTAENIHTLRAVIQLTDSDIPGTIPTFSDPSATSFTGAGGAPKNEIPVDVSIVSGASTPTVTIKNALFFAKRIG